MSFLHIHSLRIVCCLLLLSGHNSYAQDSSGDYYESARQHFDQGDGKSALIELKNALQLNPEHVPSLVLLGEVYLNNGESAAAEDALSNAMLLGADKTYVVLKFAEALLRQGKYLDVINDLPVESIPGAARIELLAYHAEAYMKLARLEDAERMLERAEKLDPDVLLPNLARIVLLVRQGELQRAQQLSERMLDMAANDSRVWNAHASVFHAQGRLGDALDYYSRAIKLDTGNADARIAKVGLLLDLRQEELAMEDLIYLEEHFRYEPRAAYLRGVVLDRLGNHMASQDALRECADIMATLPSEVIARDTQLSMSAALALYGLGDFEQARKYLKQYLRYYADDLGASRLLASVLVKQRATSEAATFLRPLLIRYPDDQQLLSLMASTYSQSGQHEKAIKLLESMRDRGLADSRINTRLALTRLGAGQDSAAIADLARLFLKDPSRAEVGFALSFAYLKERRYEEAIKVARTLVSEEPTNFSYQNLLGLVLYFADDFEAAATIFDEMLRVDSSFMPAHINLVRVQIAQGQLAAARGRLVQLLVLAPDNAALLLERARLERLEGNLAEARRWGENAVRAQTTELESRIFLTEVLLQMGEAEAAEALARETAAALDNSLESTAILGQVLARLGKTGEAQMVYRRMSRTVGFTPEPLYRIAMLQLDLGIYRDAQYSLSMAREARPDDVHATLAFVEVHLLLRQYQDVIELCDEAMDRFPRLAQWHGLQGAAYAGMGEYSSAERSYRRAHKLSQSVESTIGLYRALLAQDKWNQAEKLLRASLTDTPDEAVLKLALTEFLLLTERWEEGKLILAELLEHSPGHPQLLNNMANVKFRLHERDALDHARLAHAADASDPMINDTLGWILVQCRSAEEGLQYLRQAVTRSSTDPEIRYHLAVALHRIGREREARQELSTALAGAGTAVWRNDAESLQVLMQ